MMIMRTLEHHQCIYRNSYNFKVKYLISHLLHMLKLHRSFKALAGTSKRNQQASLLIINFSSFRSRRRMNSILFKKKVVACRIPLQLSIGPLHLGVKCSRPHPIVKIISRPMMGKRRMGECQVVVINNSEITGKL